MIERTFNVLFVCTGNSARSILAEALMNELGRRFGFQAFSAGSHPKGTIHPWTLRTLETHHLPTEGLQSKGWQQFVAAGAPKMDFIFTVCDQAAEEVCPVWPGQPMTAHWGLPDPARVEGPDEAQSRAFLDAFLTLKRRVQLMLALPHETLDRLAIQTEIQSIGAQ